VVYSYEINRALKEGGTVATMNAVEYPMPKDVSELRNVISKW